MTNYSSVAQSDAELIRLLMEDERERAHENLIEFACYIDLPAARWYRAVHLSQIARALERVERGELKRLIVVTPPRHWKSSLVSEKFPAWWLGRNPRGAVIVASYALSLAEKFSRTVRDAIEQNPRYRAVFDVRLRRDSTRVDDWTLESGTRSSLRAVGVGGGITGFGAALIIIDDPIADYAAAQSEAQRESLWEWYRQVLRTRLEGSGAIVLIQTRWHADDLAGKLIAEQTRGGEEWTVINLPARSTDGAPLWPERFGDQDLAQTRAAVGEYAWRALYLGNPSAEEGTEIKREWLRDKFFPDLPEGERWRVRWWDLAITEKQVDKPDPDFSASVKATVRNGELWLGAPVLLRGKWSDVRAEIERVYLNERQVVLGTAKSAIETMTVQEMTRAGIPFTQHAEKGDKRTRAQAWIRLAEQGRVKLVGTREQWEQFLAQWWQFPSGAHDDTVDAVSGVTMMLGLVFEAPVARRVPLGDRATTDFFRALESDR